MNVLKNSGDVLNIVEGEDLAVCGLLSDIQEVKARQGLDDEDEAEACRVCSKTEGLGHKSCIKDVDNVREKIYMG